MPTQLCLNPLDGSGLEGARRRAFNLRAMIEFPSVGVGLSAVRLLFPREPRPLSLYGCLNKVLGVLLFMALFEYLHDIEGGSLNH
jgi:hypothetical protein